MSDQPLWWVGMWVWVRVRVYVRARVRIRVRVRVRACRAPAPACVLFAILQRLHRSIDNDLLRRPQGRSSCLRAS